MSKIAYFPPKGHRSFSIGIIGSRVWAQQKFRISGSCLDQHSSSYFIVLPTVQLFLALNKEMVKVMLVLMNETSELILCEKVYISTWCLSAEFMVYQMGLAHSSNDKSFKKK